MPEAEVIDQVPTGIAAELKAKTDAALAAIKGGGFSDPAYLKELQAAMDKDAGKEPEPEPEAKVETPPAVKPPVEKPASDKKPVIEIPEEIPGELLGEKKPEKTPVQDPDSAKAEAERQKYIEEQTKGMTPKAAERFKKIELRAYEAEQKAKKIGEEKEAEKAELQKQIQDFALKAAAAVPKPEVDPVMEEMKQQLAKYEELVAKSSIAEDPRFKATYDDKIAYNIDQMKKVVPADKAEEMAQIAAMPDSPRKREIIKEIIGDLDEIDRGKVSYFIGQIDIVTSERQQALSKWKEDRVHVQARELREQQEREVKAREIGEVAMATGIGMVSSPETGYEVFRKAEGNDEWNAKVDSRLEAVKKFVSRTDIKPEQIVEMSAKAIAADEYRRMFLAQRILVKKLSEQIADLQSSEPGAGKDSGEDMGQGEDKDDFITAVVKGAKRDGGVR